MKHGLPALAADPGAPIRLGLSVHQDRDRSIHLRPLVAVTVLQPRVRFAQHPELRRVDQLGPRRAGSWQEDTEHMFGVKSAVVDEVAEFSCERVHNGNHVGDAVIHNL